MALPHLAPTFARLTRNWPTFVATYKARFQANRLQFVGAEHALLSVRIARELANLLGGKDELDRRASGQPKQSQAELGATQKPPTLVSQPPFVPAQTLPASDWRLFLLNSSRFTCRFPAKSFVGLARGESDQRGKVQRVVL